MGIYDGPNWRRWVLPLLVVILLVEVYLLLPAPVSVSVKADSPLYTPGSKGTLWVTIRNGGSKPVSGVLVVVDAPSSSVEMNDVVAVDVIPPGGEQTVKRCFQVEENALPGDHLIRVFVSLPGETRVIYKRVRVA